MKKKSCQFQYKIVNTKSNIFHVKIFIFFVHSFKFSFKLNCECNFKSHKIAITIFFVLIYLFLCSFNLLCSFFIVFPTSTHQDAVINELKNKTKMVQEKKLLQQDEVYNGALEDILLGLKSEPYRRADAVRRSQRRRIDSHRLSRTAEELEV